jgi:UDP-N-acetylmuramoyl-L-alanyl-D-glutamate--2,6-diaminopimelate ligase
MNLKTLLAALQKYDISGSPDLDITSLSYDSRKVKAGSLFAALPGLQHHGSEFQAQAEKNGAIALLSDRKLKSSATVITVDNPRQALAGMSNAFFQYPSTKLKLYGVTGTNGKTTTTFLLHSILEAAGQRSGLLGTVIYSGNDFRFDSKLTTPESLDLQEMLSRMVAEKCDACVMEVSSHSLVQSRVAGCGFEAAIFTNLTQDHLDFHKTMEDYFCAKKILFDGHTCATKSAFINKDDPYGQRLLAERKVSGLDSFSYGFSAGSNFRIREWKSTAQGTNMVIRYEGKDIKIKTPLLARYNAYNLCGAFAAATVSGIDRAAILAGVENMKQVPGRLEKIDHGQPYLVFIDYAHTEDALRQVLITLRPYTKERLIVLFGCGGERDKGKRPLMGRAAGELADEIILTSDNPRSENPAKILQDVKAGVEKSGNTDFHIIEDRKEAIAYALKLAAPGDTFLLAGKGHENYQVIGKEKQHFDEREILAELLSSTTKTQKA